MGLTACEKCRYLMVDGDDEPCSDCCHNRPDRFDAEPQPTLAPVTVAELDELAGHPGACNRECARVLRDLRPLVAEAEAKARIVAAGCEYGYWSDDTEGKQWHVYVKGGGSAMEHHPTAQAAAEWAEAQAGEWSEPIAEMDGPRASEVLLSLGFKVTVGWHDGKVLNFKRGLVGWFGMLYHEEPNKQGSVGAVYGDGTVDDAVRKGLVWAASLAGRGDGKRVWLGSGPMPGTGGE